MRKVYQQYLQSLYFLIAGLESYIFWTYAYYIDKINCFQFS